jgi:hypothetical protein
LLLLRTVNSSAGPECWSSTGTGAARQPIGCRQAPAVRSFRACREPRPGRLLPRERRRGGAETSTRSRSSCGASPACRLRSRGRRPSTPAAVLSGFGPIDYCWVVPSIRRHAAAVWLRTRRKRRAGRAALRIVGGLRLAVSLRAAHPKGAARQGMARVAFTSPRRRTTESSSKHQKDCGLRPRLRARCGHPRLGGRVHSRTGGGAGTSRTSGSGSRARAPFPS